MTQPRIAIIGLGSIGSRHVDNLLAMGFTDLIGMDTRPMEREARLPVVDSLEAVLAYEPTHALICTPPNKHYVTADLMIHAGCHVFIEKPITTTASCARLLCEAAERFNVILAVGYMLRAFQPLKEIKRSGFPMCEGNIWCHWNAEPKTYDQSDALLETSHELDLALWMFGPVEKIKISAVASNGQAAYLELIHESGALTKISLETRSTYSRGIMYRRFWSDIIPYQLTYEPQDLDGCYKDEVRAFLDGQPLCTGRDGLAVMDLIERLK